MSRKIKCQLALCDLTLVAKKGVPMPPRMARPPHAKEGQASSFTHNEWPWKLMRADESVLIPWGYIPVNRIINSINGYCKNASGAMFSFRSTAFGLRVWCIKQVER